MRLRWTLVGCIVFLANAAIAEDDATDASAGIAVTTDESADDGATDDGATDDGATDDGATDDGATDDETEDDDEDDENEADDEADDGGEDDEGAQLDTPVQRRSYAVGVSIGRGLKKDGGELDSELVARGLRDALAGGELQLTNDEIRAAVTVFRKRVKAAAITSAASAEQVAFLRKNALADDVVLLPGGLQYRVLVDGNGPRPTPTGSVKVHYRGTLVDGTVFDETKSTPATFRLNGLIAAWQIVIPKMKVGSKWQLVVPPEFGYGATARDKIPANSVMIFEIELDGVE